MLSKNKGGLLHYLGNRNLTLPMHSGRMEIDKNLLDDHFAVIIANSQGKKFKRCFDPLSGSASWSLAAMELGLADQYIINDSDEALINTLCLIKEAPKRVKSKYESLIREYDHSDTKKEFFLKIISDYNQANLDEKSLLLPFIINHSWGGILLHDDQGNIVYREVNIKGKTIQRYLDEASLSLEVFFEEVDRTSNLLNKNNVILKSGDFLHALSDLQTGDFVVMNPPYPETARARSGNSGMYRELYPGEVLYNNLVDIVRKMENNNVEYYLTYGCHDPEMKKFIIKDESNRLRHYFRVLGQENCAFGIGLDQLYLPTKYSIPENMRYKIIPANDVLQGQELTAAEALENFRKIAQERKLN